MFHLLLLCILINDIIVYDSVMNSMNSKRSLLNRANNYIR